MAITPHVWTFNDLTVNIYSSDGISDSNGDLLFSECYLQDMSLTGQQPKQRRKVTGRPQKKLVAEGPMEYIATLTRLFFQKALELTATKILSSCDNWINIEFKFNDPAFGDTPPFSNDTFTLVRCRCNFSITGRDNDLIQCTLAVEAEDMV